MRTFQLALVLLGFAVLAAGQDCIVPFEYVAGKCVYIESTGQDGMTWLEARDYCKGLGGDQVHSDLATFPTCDEYVEFSEYLGFNVEKDTSLWMGAHTEFEANMWQWITLEHLQTGVPFWSYHEDYSSGGNCAATSQYYYRLMAYDCNEKKGFACSYSLPSDFEQKVSKPIVNENCGGHTDAVIIGGICYIIHDKYETFTEAERKCRDDHSDFGGELFYPETCDEFTHMVHHLESSESHRDYWVGAIDVSGEEEWTWVNGDLVPGGPPFWASGEPSHQPAPEPRSHCAMMETKDRYYLKDEPCDKEHLYICKLTSVSP